MLDTPQGSAPPTTTNLEPVVITLRGHLTVAALEAELDALAKVVAESNEVPVIVDCLEMTGYDVLARASFIDFHKRWRNNLLGVAIVTDRVAWKGVVLAMAMASSTKMRAFGDQTSAKVWLRTLAAPPPSRR